MSAQALPVRRARWRVRQRSLGVYVGALLFSAIVLLPLYWMVRSAFASAADLNKIPPIYFPGLTTQNFATLITQVPFFEYVRNSLVFSLATTLLTLLVSFLAAYAFARIEFPGSGVLLWVLVASMALPDV